MSSIENLPVEELKMFAKCLYVYAEPNTQDRLYLSQKLTQNINLLQS